MEVGEWFIAINSDVTTLAQYLVLDKNLICLNPNDSRTVSGTVPVLTITQFVKMLDIDWLYQKPWESKACEV